MRRKRGAQRDDCGPQTRPASAGATASPPPRSSLDAPAQEREVAQLLEKLELLQASERRHRYLIEHMREGVGIVDLEERFIFCNPSAERLFGVAPGELAGRSLREFVSAEDFVRMKNETELRRRGLESNYELEIRARDGIFRILSVTAVPWLDPNQRVGGAFATFRDITAQREAEAALREERRRARQYLDVASVILVAIGKDRRVTMINRKGCELLGLPADEIVGAEWFETFIPPRHRRDVSRTFERIMAGELDPVEYFENPVLTARGEERLIAWHNSLVRDSAGAVTGALSSGEDITERKQAETQIVGLERMRAMARLAAAVSHNLNNILAGVTARCQFLQRSARDDTVLKEAAAIMKAAKRAEDLVRRLGWAVMGRDETVGPVSVKEQVQRAVAEIELVCTRSGISPLGGVGIKASYDDTTPVIATPEGLREVVHNVLLNAVEAMPRGGTIEVSTRETPDAVRVIVRDEGEGMDEQTRAHAFEPFYTTKAEVGTGLGLSTVYGAVLQWGGDVKLQSSPGLGTTVVLSFRKCPTAALAEG